MSTLTVYSDTTDGYVQSSNATYSTARSGGGGFITNTTATLVYAGGQTLSGGTYYVYEAFLAFDTSALGAGASVSVATLSLNTNVNSSTTDYTINARLYDWGTSITSGDYIAGASLSGNTLLAHQDTSSLAAINSYNTFTNNAFPANVNVTGSTRIVLCSSRTESNNTPTGDEYVKLYSADQSGTTQDPKLDITYTVPVPFSQGVVVW